jgi:DNA-binding NarL/FixJ family response regulator
MLQWQFVAQRPAKCAKFGRGVIDGSRSRIAAGGYVMAETSCPANGDGRPAHHAPLVYIASHVRLYRETLANSLSQHGGVRVAGDGSWSEAQAVLATLRPDVLLLDLSANDSLLVPRRAQAICPGLRVVAFAVAEVEADVLACAEAGICGYVAQNGSVADVVETVLRAVSGELVCPPRIVAQLFCRVASLAADRPAADRPAGDCPGAGVLLTSREQEIAVLLASGLSNKHIARRLRLANATVKNHVHNILQKLKLERRGEIAALHLAAAGWQLPPGAGDGVTV